MTLLRLNHHQCPCANLLDSDLVLSVRLTALKMKKLRFALRAPVTGSRSVDSNSPYAAS
jgi:hypothetical protein